MTTLVIAGAYYKIEDKDVVVCPHYTGEFSIVDCDVYLNKEDFLDVYDEQYLFRDYYIEVGGKKYYYAEYKPFYVDENWTLLSDLSKLRYREDLPENCVNRNYLL